MTIIEIKLPQDKNSPYSLTTLGPDTQLRLYLLATHPDAVFINDAKKIIVGELTFTDANNLVYAAELKNDAFIIFSLFFDSDFTPPRL